MLNTQKASSVRQNIVICERRLRTRMLLPGLWNINLDESGCGDEQLYAKKMVTERDAMANRERNKENELCFSTW